MRECLHSAYIQWKALIIYGILQENDNTVRIWDVVNKQERAVLQGHDAAVSSGA